MFRIREIVALTGLASADIESRLKSGIAEIVEGRPGYWRLREPSFEIRPRQPSAEIGAKMLDEADRILTPIERGLICEPDVRDLSLGTVAEQLRLVRQCETASISIESRLRLMYDRLRRLQATRRPDAAAIVGQLADWTVGLSPAVNGEAFDLGRALSEAKHHPEDIHQIFAPAQMALTAKLELAEKLATADELDNLLRHAALAADVFTVLSLACVGAAIGVARIADAMIAAITTPGFAAAADRTARRIAYSALASLARPNIDDPRRAAYACSYLLLRESSGRDELELLAPAALQLADGNQAGPLLLLGRWLKWEADQDSQSYENGLDAFLPRLGHAARNLGCSLEILDYRPLQHGLLEMVDEEHRRALILFLGTVPNNALRMTPFGTGMGVEARLPVASTTGLRRPRQSLVIPEASSIAELIQDLPLREGRETRVLSKLFRQALSQRRRNAA
jgi:hypothetical protein